MALDPKSKQIFDHHLNSKINKNLNCYVCGKSEWQDGEFVGLPVIEKAQRHFAKETGVAGHVSLTCSNCGLVIFFSAEIVGLVGIGDQPSLN